MKKFIFILGLVVASANFSKANCMAFWKKKTHKTELTPVLAASNAIEALKAEISSKIAAIETYIDQINTTLGGLPERCFSNTIQNLKFINTRFKYCKTNFEKILRQLSEANFAESTELFKILLDLMKVNEKSFKKIQDRLNS
jgi:hypothetical protein